MATEDIQPSDSMSTGGIANGSVESATAPAPAAAPIAAPEYAMPAQPLMQGGVSAEDMDARRQQMTKDAARTEAATNENAAPPPPGPHARLLGMIQGLSIGLGAAAHSMATGGREGGAKEVSEVQAAEQQQRINAQKAREETKSQHIQQAIQVAQTHEANWNNIVAMSTLPQDIEAKHLDIQGKQLGVIGATQDIRTKALQDLETTGDLGAYQDTLKKVGGVSGAPAETTPSTALAGSVGAVPPVVVTRWQNSIDSAASAYPNDPVIKAAAAVLANPKAKATDAAIAASGAANRMKALDTGVASREKQQNADPLFKLENDPAEMQGEKASAAIALINNKLKTEKDPAQLARLQRLSIQAGHAHEGYLADKQAEETAKQLAIQGTPEAAGQALYDGTVTLADLQSKGITPDFKIKAVNAATAIAAKNGEKYNASDETVGESLLKQAGTQAFFGSGHSLIGADGTLKQLADAGLKIPQSRFPKANTVADWVKIQSGGGEMGGYAATLLGVADDYGKVMGGGSATDSARYTAEALAAMNASPASRAAAIEGIRHSVESQLNARIGTNRYVRQREGYDLPTPKTAEASPTASPAGSAAGKLHANLTDFVHHFTGAKGTIYSDDGSTWYDGTGNLVK